MRILIGIITSCTSCNNAIFVGWASPTIDRSGRFLRWWAVPNALREMKNYNRIKLQETLRTSYWFVPGLMTGAAMGLAFTMLKLDLAGKSRPMEKLGLVIYTGGPDGGADAAFNHRWLR